MGGLVGSAVRFVLSLVGLSRVDMTIKEERKKEKNRALGLANTILLANEGGPLTAALGFSSAEPPVLRVPRRPDAPLSRRAAYRSP